MLESMSKFIVEHPIGSCLGSAVVGGVIDHALFLPDPITVTREPDDQEVVTMFMNKYGAQVRQMYNENQQLKSFIMNMDQQAEMQADIGMNLLADKKSLKKLKKIAQMQKSLDRDYKKLSKKPGKKASAKTK